VSELLESGGGLLAIVAAALFVLWALHYLFGAQVFGLPAMIGVLVVIAVGSAIPTLGLVTVAAMAAGLLVLFAVIGMAMTLGPEKIRTPPRHKRNGS
jgi:hypothetical protein